MRSGLTDKKRITMVSSSADSAYSSSQAPAVLVVEAQAIGMIGVIRSLGRAGYVVHAAAGSAAAPGLKSKFARHHAVYPGYQHDDFLPWLRDYIQTHSIRCIIPSEGFLIAIRSAYEEFRSLLPDAPIAESLYRCFAKTEVELCCANTGDKALLDAVPKAYVVKRAQIFSEDSVADWHWPVWLKTDARDADDQLLSFVQRIDSLSKLTPAITQALASHQQCLLQEHVPGVKATVNLWRHKGQIQARSMCLALHENPHTGGLTAYRKFWWHEAMCQDAEKRLAALGWEGVAMVEYRWDAASQHFWFLELNARYWNALNMDLLAGKDFPRWQVDALFNKTVHQDLSPGPLGFSARYTVPADIGYLMSFVRDSRISLARRCFALLEWCWLAVNPQVKSDLWFKGDRALYFRAWYTFLSRLGRAE